MKITLTYKKKSEIIPIPNYKSSKKTNRRAIYHTIVFYILYPISYKGRSTFTTFIVKSPLYRIPGRLSSTSKTLLVNTPSHFAERYLDGRSFIKKISNTCFIHTLCFGTSELQKRERQKRELGWARSKHGAKTSCSKYTYTQYSFNCLFLITTQVGREVTGGQRSFRD